MMQQAVRMSMDKPPLAEFLYGSKKGKIAKERMASLRDEWLKYVDKLSPPLPGARAMADLSGSHVDSVDKDDSVFLTKVKDSKVEETGAVTAAAEGFIVGVKVVAGAKFQCVVEYGRRRQKMQKVVQKRTGRYPHCLWRWSGVQQS